MKEEEEERQQQQRDTFQIDRERVRPWQLSVADKLKRVGVACIRIDDRPWVVY